MTLSRRRALQALLVAPALVPVARPRARAQNDAPAALSGELTFWHGLGTKAALLNDRIIPAWTERYPDVTVNVLQVPFDQLRAKYVTEAAAGAGPDVLLGASDWIGEYFEADVIQPDDLAGDDFAGGYNPTAIEGVTYEDQIYAVPQNINGVALFYNRELIPTPPANTDDLLAMAAQVAQTPDRQGFGLIANLYSNAGYLYGLGGQIFTEDGLSAFDSPETIQFFDLLRTLSPAPGVVTDSQQGNIESSFREGRLGMMFNGPWFLQAANESLGAEAVGVAVLPAISSAENAPAQPFVGIQSLYVDRNAEADQAQLAFAFARWMSEEGTQIFVAEAGQLPASTAVALPAENQSAPVFLQQYEAGVPLPSNPLMTTVFTAAEAAIPAVLEGSASPDEAGREAKETIDSSAE